MKRLVLVGSCLSLFACDVGRDVTVATLPGEPAALRTEPGALRVDPGAERVGPSLRPPARDGSPALETAFHPRLRHPLDGASLDNDSCEAAVALPDDGARAVPTDERFFKVAIGPGEVVTVKSPQGLSISLWMSAAPACDVVASDSDWTALWGGIVLANPGRDTIERVITVNATPSADLQAFDLDVTRARIAEHTRCEDARPLPAAGLRGERMSRAGVSATDAAHWFSRALYYSVEIPPMTRAIPSVTTHSHAVVVTSLGLTVFDDCADETPSFFPELANATDAPLTGIIEFGAQWEPDDRFDLSVAFEPLGADASCERPRTLAAGEGATFDIQGGGVGPGSCGCLSPRRVGHLDVTVPAGGGVVARAQTVAESGTQLIEVPEACADVCGDLFASGWGETPAELVLTNDGDRDVVRHFIVTANEVWDADGTHSTFPPVTVTVTAAE